MPRSKKTPAHEGELGHQRNKLHEGLRKAESSLAIQLQTKKTGFAAFLHPRRVPDVVSPACHCGYRRQDRKHVIIFCPNHAYNRRRLYETAGTNRYQEIMSTGNGLRAVARWVTNEGLLSQFSLAKEQSDWVEGKDKGDGYEVDNNSNNNDEHEHKQEETSEREHEEKFADTRFSRGKTAIMAVEGFRRKGHAQWYSHTREA